MQDSVELSTKSEEITRIAISKQTNKILSDLTARVNDGFIGGKVTKVEVLDWLIQKYGEEAPEQDIGEIRGKNYSEITLLENMLKMAKESGKIPEDLKILLQKQFLQDGVQRRKK